MLQLELGILNLRAGIILASSDQWFWKRAQLLVWKVRAWVQVILALWWKNYGEKIYTEVRFVVSLSVHIFDKSFWSLSSKHWSSAIKKSQTVKVILNDEVYQPVVFRVKYTAIGLHRLVAALEPGIASILISKKKY